MDCFVVHTIPFALSFLVWTELGTCVDQTKMEDPIPSLSVGWHGGFCWPIMIFLDVNVIQTSGFVDKTAPTPQPHCWRSPDLVMRSRPCRLPLLHQERLLGGGGQSTWSNSIIFPIKDYPEATKIEYHNPQCGLKPEIFEKWNPKTQTFIATHADKVSWQESFMIFYGGGQHDSISNMFIPNNQQ